MEVIHWLYTRFFYHPLEVPALVFSLAYVLFAMRQAIWCWPCGIIGGVLYAYVFWLSGFNAEMGTYVFYTLMCIYGWYHWLHPGPERPELPITKTAPGLAIALLGIAVVGSVALGRALQILPSHVSWLNESTYPYPDSASSVLGLIAQWMTARKLIENWHVWVVVNAIGIVMFTLKGLTPTAILYAVFLILAVLGYLAWRKAMLAQSNQNAEIAECAE